MKGSLMVLAALLGFTPAAANAQRFEYRGSLWLTGVKARSVYAGGAEALGGRVLGFEARAYRGRFGVRLNYGQGSLEPDTAGPDARDYVEGSLQLSAAVIKGLEVSLGPFARAYTSSAGTQRWMFMQLRARYEAPIVSMVSGYAELWGGLSGTVNVAESYNGARGGAAGIVWRVTKVRGAPLTVRLSYGIDEARLAGGRRETVEATTLALALAR